MDQNQNQDKAPARLSPEREVRKRLRAAQRLKRRAEEIPLARMGKARALSDRTVLGSYPSGSVAKVTLSKMRTPGHRWIYEVSAGGGRLVMVYDLHQGVAEFLSASLNQFRREFSALQETLCNQTPAPAELHESDRYRGPSAWAVTTFWQEIKQLVDHWPTKIMESWW